MLDDMNDQSNPTDMRRIMTLCEMKNPMLRVYHAQSHVIPAVLKNRQITNYNSMGTWFTNSRDMASTYGKNITAYDIPAEGYLEIGHDDMNATIGINGPLITKHFGRADADHLDQYPWSAKARIELAKLRKRAQDHRDDWNWNRQQEQPWFRRLIGLEKSLEISQKALKSAAYCTDFRQMIEGDIHQHGFGYRGLVWRGVKFDGWDGRPADIYLLFHRDDIQPIRLNIT